MYRWVINSKLK